MALVCSARYALIRHCGKRDSGYGSFRGCAAGKIGGGGASGACPGCCSLDAEVRAAQRNGKVGGAWYAVVGGAKRQQRIFNHFHLLLSGRLARRGNYRDCHLHRHAGDNRQVYIKFG
jgi:hypothetical protein